MTLPAALVQEKNKLSNAYPWLVLLDIELTPVLTLYLTSDTTEVSFNGQTYVPFPMEIGHIPQSLSGEIPEINLGVSNVDRVMQGYIEALDGAVDCDVTLRVVHKNNLTADYTDLERHFKIMATVCDSYFVYFTLGLISPTQRRFPLYRTMGNHCNWLFKGIECGYSGGAEQCDHTLKTCQSLLNSTRFGGFPGLNNSGVRFV